MEDQASKEVHEITKKWCSLMVSRRWRSMVELTQKTWRAGAGAKVAAQFIANIYKPFKTKRPQVVEIVKVSDVFYKAVVTVETIAGKKALSINVIKEAAPYKPSAEGEWGINPVSAMIGRKQG